MYDKLYYFLNCKRNYFIFVYTVLVIVLPYLIKTSLRNAAVKLSVLINMSSASIVILKKWDCKRNSLPQFFLVLYSSQGICIWKHLFENDMLNSLWSIFFLRWAKLHFHFLSISSTKYLFFCGNYLSYKWFSLLKLTKNRPYLLLLSHSARNSK